MTSGRASKLDTGAAKRVINDRTVVVEHDELGNYYQWIDQCVLGSLQTSTATRPAWNDEDVAMLASIHIATDQVTLTLPPGWSVVNAGTANPLIQLVFDVEIRGTTRTVVLGQSIGGAITALPGMTGRSLPRTRFQDGRHGSPKVPAHQPCCSTTTVSRSDSGAKTSPLTTSSVSPPTWHSGQTSGANCSPI